MGLSGAPVHQPRDWALSFCTRTCTCGADLTWELQWGPSLLQNHPESLGSAGVLGRVSLSRDGLLDALSNRRSGSCGPCREMRGAPGPPCAFQGPLPPCPPVLPPSKCSLGREVVLVCMCGWESHSLLCLGLVCGSHMGPRTEKLAGAAAAEENPVSEKHSAPRTGAWERPAGGGTLFSGQLGEREAQGRREGWCWSSEPVSGSQRSLSVQRADLSSDPSHRWRPRWSPGGRSLGFAHFCARALQPGRQRLGPSGSSVGRPGLSHLPAAASHFPARRDLLWVVARENNSQNSLSYFSLI